MLELTLLAPCLKPTCASIDVVSLLLHMPFHMMTEADILRVENIEKNVSMGEKEHRKICLATVDEKR